VPSLYACLGHPLAVAVNALLTRCDDHGFQPIVLMCSCLSIVDDALRPPPAAATMDGVFCAEHIAGFEEEDPAADDLLEEWCFQCLVDAGLLPGARAA
jgi:hypothetical protein